MAAMKRFLPIAAAFALAATADGTARADTIYQCRAPDGTPHFYFNTKPAGAKCTVYGIDRKEEPPKGAKCRVQRFRDTVFHTCEKDGITWYFNKPPARKAKPALASAGDADGARRAGSAPADADETASRIPAARPGLPDEDAEPVELAGMDSRRMDGAFLRDIVTRASAAQGIPVALLRAVIEVESGANPDVVSPAGAQGLMQLMPVTAGYLDVEDPFDPEQNVMAGARLLRMLSDRFHGDVRKTVAAYYAGANAVRRAGGVPTRSAESYVAKVLSRYEKYSISGQ